MRRELRALVREFGRIENGVKLVLVRGKIFADRREDEIDHLRLPRILAISDPLESAYAVRVLRIGFTKLDALQAVQFKVTQFINLAVFLARVRAVIKGLETNIGGKVFGHRRNIPDEKCCVARRAVVELLALDAHLVPTLRQRPSNSLLLPIDCLPTCKGLSLGGRRLRPIYRLAAGGGVRV